MEFPPVIMDPGSYSLKAGLPGDRPSAEVPSLIARPRAEYDKLKFGGKDYTYVGSDAVSKRGVCSIRYPIDHGFVTRWDDYETLIRHAYYEELRIIPEEHPLLITEHPLNPKGNTEKIVQMAFESLNVPFLSVYNTSVLSLIAEGTDTGLAIELGDGSFKISSINEGCLLRHLTPRIPWGGRYITDLMRKQIIADDSLASADQKAMMQMSMLWETLNDIKQKCCFVSQDYERDMNLDSSSHEFTYEFPDGTDLKLTKERFIAPESIFKPELMGIEMFGLPRQASDALKRAGDDLKTKLLSNVVISGGCSLIPGLPERFQKELEFYTEQKVKTVASPNRKYSVWIGGSRMAALPFDPERWFSKEEYDEHGPTLIFRKLIGWLKN